MSRKVRGRHEGRERGLFVSAEEGDFAKECDSLQVVVALRVASGR